MKCIFRSSETVTTYIIKDWNKHLMIGAVTDFKMLQIHFILTWLIAQEDFINWACSQTSNLVQLKKIIEIISQYSKYYNGVLIIVI
jgi:hypothetical protein